MQLILLAIAVYFAAFAIAVALVGEMDNTQPADVIIVLGAGLREDGHPGPALARRSRHAAELWRRGLAPLALCTGGQTETSPRSEADACREVLRAAGVPASAILLEAQSRSTEENAIFSRQILAEYDLRQAILVSDAGHMLRARWLFHRHGISAYASPAPTRNLGNAWARPRQLLREFIAFNWQLFKEILQLPVTHIRGI